MVETMVKQELENTSSVTKGKALLNVEEVAIRLECRTDLVLKLVKSKQIKAFEVDGEFYVKEVNLKKFINDETSENISQNSGKNLDFGLQERYNHSPIMEEIISEEEYEQMVRNGKGEGTVYFNQDRQKWQGAVSAGYDINGKRIRKIISGESEEAVRIAIYNMINKNLEVIRKEQTIAVMPINQQNVKSDITFGQMSDEYLEMLYKKSDKRSNENYRSDAKRMDDLRDIKVVDITRKFCLNYLYELTGREYEEGKLYSGNIINKTKKYMRRVLKEAVREKIIDREVLEDWGQIESKAVQKNDEEEYKALKDEEIIKIYNAVEKNQLIKILILAIRDTGARTQEVAGLSFENVKQDEDGYYIYVKEALSHKCNNEAYKPENKEKKLPRKIPIIKGLKNEWAHGVLIGRRNLRITKETWDAIQSFKATIESDQDFVARRKENGNEDRIFTHMDGTLKTMDYYSRQYRELIKKAGLKEEGYNPYRFRHNFCTRLLRMGLDPKTVARMMGDKDIEMVLRVYNSIDKGEIKKASEEFIKAFTFEK
ncbi:MAG TPA: hypothetical protein DCP90_07810 [Clostridiales bacterium]|nr:MAG: hypothetical protein A2Y22_06005 [Clostridiales bacterium GWD2_32_59]HAN10504.1 hypothetical protein [Clostridiales bacterium]